MTLDNVISAAFALSRQERHVLFQTIAVAENWAITVESGWSDATKAETKLKSETNWDAIDKLVRPIAEGLGPANNRKAYSAENLELLKEIAAIKPGSMEERPQMRQAAKKLGRTYKAIAEKIRTIRAE